MKKVAVIGHFAFGLEYLDGQTIKTKIVADELCRRYGEDQVEKIDTHGGMKTLFKIPFQIFHTLKNSKNVIILPAHNGLRVNAPLLAFARNFFKNRRIHYVVIGGWLPEFLKKRKNLMRILKSFDGIYVETNTMRKELEEQGFTNVHVMPNCKNLNILEKSQLIYHHSEPYKLCTFSRVMKEKGIEDAVEAVNVVNEHFGRIVYTLDIYGQVDPEQTEWFEQLKSNLPDCAKYRGIVPFNQSVEVLKKYFALIFPTGFFTEGIPGTIIDAYAAGVPVISSEWESFSDVVDDDVTGIGYEFGKNDELHIVLENIAINPQIIQNMKTACIEKAKEFTPEIALDVLTRGGYLFDLRTIKHIPVLSPVLYNAGISEPEPLPLCTFSRVMREKGIEDAVHAVEAVNEYFGRTIYTLDIYGQVDFSQTEWFDELKSKFPSYVKYGGLVPFDKSVEVLKNYFALLFPTYYEGEGFAGTLIDALAAGVPVIASDWRYNSEIVTNGVTGKIHKAQSERSLKEALMWSYKNQNLWNSMKSNCIKLAYQYLPEKAIDILVNQIK